MRLQVTVLSVAFEQNPWLIRCLKRINLSIFKIKQLLADIEKMHHTPRSKQNMRDTDAQDYFKTTQNGNSAEKMPADGKPESPPIEIGGPSGLEPTR